MTASTLYADYEFDYNTLIPQLNGPEWIRDVNTPSITPVQAFSNEIGVERAVRIGLLGVQAARGLTCVPLAVPPGIQGGSFDVSLSIVSGDNRVNLAIYDDTLTTRLFETTVTHTAGTTVKTYSLPTTLGPGQYFAALETNHLAQQASPIIWDIRYTPNFSTVAGSVFAKPFKRFQCKPWMLHGNIKTNQISNRYRNQSAGSRWMFRVSGATRCAVRTWLQNLGNPVVNPVSFYVQGEAQGRGAQNIPDLAYSTDEFDIPQRQEPILIGFKGAQQQQWVATSNRGSFFWDAYFPIDAVVQPVPPPISSKRLILLGDSLMLGSSSTIPETMGFNSYIETRYPGVVFYEAAASRWFQQVFGAAGDTTTPAAYAQEIAKANPTDIGIQIGVNDYLNNATAAWTPASIETAFGVALDALHAACPGAIIYVFSPWIRGGTDTAINGLTMAQLRTAWQNAATAASRAAWCRFKSGTASDCPTTAQILGDNTHLNTDGHAIAGPAWCSFLGI